MEAGHEPVEPGCTLLITEGLRKAGSDHNSSKLPSDRSWDKCIRANIRNHAIHRDHGSVHSESSALMIFRNTFMDLPATCAEALSLC